MEMAFGVPDAENLNIRREFFPLIQWQINLLLGSGQAFFTLPIAQCFL